jgi:hypothetical protein
MIITSDLRKKNKRNKFNQKKLVERLSLYLWQNSIPHINNSKYEYHGVRGNIIHIFFDGYRISIKCNYNFILRKITVEYDNESITDSLVKLIDKAIVYIQSTSSMDMDIPIYVNLVDDVTWKIYDNMEVNYD